MIIEQRENGVAWLISNIGKYKQLEPYPSNGPNNAVISRVGVATQTSCQLFMDGER